MITSRQVRAARALLGWTQEMLADKALTALKRLESDRLQVQEDSVARWKLPASSFCRPGVAKG